jgi:hypothetical protein
MKDPDAPFANGGAGPGRGAVKVQRASRLLKRQRGKIPASLYKVSLSISLIDLPGYHLIRNEGSIAVVADIERERTRERTRQGHFIYVASSVDTLNIENIVLWFLEL